MHSCCFSLLKSHLTLPKALPIIFTLLAVLSLSIGSFHILIQSSKELKSHRISPFQAINHYSNQLKNSISFTYQPNLLSSVSQVTRLLACTYFNLDQFCSKLHSSQFSMLPVDQPQVQSRTQNLIIFDTFSTIGHQVKTQDSLQLPSRSSAALTTCNNYRTIGHQVKTQPNQLINSGQLGIKSRPRLHSYNLADPALPILGLLLAILAPLGKTRPWPSYFQATPALLTCGYFQIPEPPRPVTSYCKLMGEHGVISPPYPLSINTSSPSNPHDPGPTATVADITVTTFLIAVVPLRTHGFITLEPSNPHDLGPSAVAVNYPVNSLTHLAFSIIAVYASIDFLVIPPRSPSM